MNQPTVPSATPPPRSTTHSAAAQQGPVEARPCRAIAAWYRWTVLILFASAAFEHRARRTLHLISRVALRSIPWRRQGQSKPVSLTLTHNPCTSEPLASHDLVLSPLPLMNVLAQFGVTRDEPPHLRCALLREVHQPHKSSRVYRITWAGTNPHAPRAGIVLKRIVLRTPPSSVPREVAVYGAPFLHRLPAPLFAARCFDSAVHPQGYDLWLEDLGPRTRAVRVQTDDIRHAACALGQFNGQQWTAELPAGELPNLTLARAVQWSGGDEWRDAITLGSALRRRLEALAERRELLLSAFASLDMVFCHQDASPLNLRFVKGRVGRIGILDWELCGRAPMGQELVPLVWGRWQHARGDEVEARELEAWKGYLVGVERVGSQLRRADREEMRFAYLVGLTIRYANAVAAIADPGLIDLLIRRGEEAVAMAKA